MSTGALPPVAEALEQIYALQAQSRDAEVEQRLDALAAAMPHEPAVHRTAAFVAQRAGRMDAAITSMRMAVELAPDSGQLRLELGQVLAASGRMEHALPAFEEAVRLEPGLVEGWWLLGMGHYNAGHEEAAAGALRRALALAPGRIEIQRGLAEIEFALEHFAEALPLFAGLHSRAPADPAISLRYGQCLARTGAPARALDVYAKALRSSPMSADLWQAQALAHEDAGDAEAARECYARAHALRPDWADPVGGLLMLGRGNADEAVMQQALDLLTGGTLPQAQREYLHYAVGKVHDARGEHSQAMSHWQSANGLRRARTGDFDLAALQNRVEEAMSSFDRALFESLRPGGSEDPRPVFVVGMPRSGTTLVEQILATHPQAHGCGELVDIVAIASSIPTDTGLRWPQEAARLEASSLRTYANRYLAVASRGLMSPVERLVDKQPYNFFHVGLIALLFPRARILWCRRDPRDTALSIYSESFSPASNFATDLDDIRHLIHAHEALMSHWQRVVPLPIMEVRYESLVTDFDRQARRLVEFVGLWWDETCLQFHSNDRAVQTPSRWQVRQPVHSRSVDRWRHHAEWFAGWEP